MMHFNKHIFHTAVETPAAEMLHLLDSFGDTSLSRMKLIEKHACIHSNDVNKTPVRLLM